MRFFLVFLEPVSIFDASVSEHERNNTLRDTQLAYLGSIFVIVFLAELGDKTQLATVVFAAEGKSPALYVFIAAAAALVASTALAVLLGTVAERYLSELPLKLMAGTGFILIGLWTIVDHFRAS